MATAGRPVVTTEVGPREVVAGVVYVHILELEDTVNLHPGLEVGLADGSGQRLVAVVALQLGPRWQLLLQD